MNATATLKLNVGGLLIGAVGDFFIRYKMDDVEIPCCNPRAVAPSYRSELVPSDAVLDAITVESATLPDGTEFLGPWGPHGGVKRAAEWLAYKNLRRLVNPDGDEGEVCLES